MCILNVVHVQLVKCTYYLQPNFFSLNQNEVARAIELRDIVTSLGPAYIKLGQALSIRPDILSPVAMVELQKLCDKVNYLAFLYVSFVSLSLNRNHYIFPDLY